MECLIDQQGKNQKTDRVGTIYTSKTGTLDLITLFRQITLTDG